MLSPELEIWTPVFGFPDYQISSLGKVKRGEKVLAQDKAGRKRCRHYKAVSLYKSGKRFHLVVHKLMWLSFFGEIPIGHHIDHINHCHSDNTLQNLQCICMKENQKRKRIYETAIRF